MTKLINFQLLFRLYAVLFLTETSSWRGGSPATSVHAQDTEVHSSAGGAPAMVDLLERSKDYRRMASVSGEFPDTLSTILIVYLEALDAPSNMPPTPDMPNVPDELTVLRNILTVIPRDSSKPTNQTIKSNNKIEPGSDSECIVVDITYYSSYDADSHKADLQEKGSSKTVCIDNQCSACLPADAIVPVARLQDVVWVEPAISILVSNQGKRRRNLRAGSDPANGARSSLSGDSLDQIRRLVGSVTSEGDAAMQTDVVRSTYGVDGSGLTIGVLSDSFDCYGEAVQDIYSGDIPVDVRVPPGTDYYGFCSDEGRAMMQLIHDVAPGASLVFRSAVYGQVSFAQNIRDMASIDGCDIIVDDIQYFAEPMFQDGIIAQAVDAVVRDYNALYFSAAGNNGDQSYESAFRPVIDPDDGLIKHNFNPYGEVDTHQTVRVNLPFNSSGSYFYLIVQWDQPFGNARSDIDIVANATEDNEWVYVYAYGGSDNNIGRAPIEFMFVDVYVNDTYYDKDYVDVDIQIIVQKGDPPGLVKWINFGVPLTLVEYDTKSSTSYGHCNAANAFGVGAAEYNNTPPFGVSPAVKEYFSSKGGTPILFDTSGNRLPDPEIRLQPGAVGPDGTQTTFFYREVDGKFYFFGTSASAPHVAAFAALLLEQDPSLTPAEVYSIIQESADDMEPLAIAGGTTFDFETGYGFVNAVRAFEILSNRPPVAVPTHSPVKAPSSGNNGDGDGGHHGSGSGKHHGSGSGKHHGSGSGKHHGSGSGKPEHHGSGSGKEPEEEHGSGSGKEPEEEHGSGSGKEPEEEHHQDGGGSGSGKHQGSSHGGGKSNDHSKGKGGQGGKKAGGSGKSNQPGKMGKGGGSSHAKSKKA